MIIEGIIFSVILFVIGLVGILLNHRNALLMMIHIELLLLAVNTNFVVFNQFSDNPDGHLFVFFILTAVAAETAIGLAIFVLMYRRSNSVDTQAFNEIKG